LKRRELKKIEQLKNENVWKILKSSTAASPSVVVAIFESKKKGKNL
jgi:hypothetical protein